VCLNVKGVSEIAILITGFLVALFIASVHVLHQYKYRKAESILLFSFVLSVSSPLSVFGLIIAVYKYGESRDNNTLIGAAWVGIGKLNEPHFRYSVTMYVVTIAQHND